MPYERMYPFRRSKYLELTILSFLKHFKSECIVFVIGGFVKIWSFVFRKPNLYFGNPNTCCDLWYRPNCRSTIFIFCSFCFICLEKRGGIPLLPTHHMVWAFKGANSAINICIFSLKFFEVCFLYSTGLFWAVPFSKKNLIKTLIFAFEANIATQSFFRILAKYVLHTISLKRQLQTIQSCQCTKCHCQVEKKAPNPT